MPTLNYSDSKDMAKVIVPSLPNQQSEQSVLPQFTGKLKVDEGLKLSHDNFKQTIDDFFEDQNITALSQLTATPDFPLPHVLAQFASKAYTDYEKRETDAQYETRLALPDGWKLLTTASNSSKTNGYFGAAYWHPEHQQVVIAHRGTEWTNLGALWTDVVGVVFKHHVPQMESASTFAHKVVEVLREVNRIKGVSFQLFFTGHSLGGWLAQVTTFTTEYLKREENTFLKSDNEQDCYHPHSVVFDSPGCRDMLSQMRDTFDVRLDGCSTDIEHLDITSYLSAPNRINTCNAHLGTVYRIFTDLSDIGWHEKHTALYNLAAHSMERILEAFYPETGQAQKDEHGQLKVQVVIDWPISSGLLGGEEYNSFFKWAEHLNNYHPEVTHEILRLKDYHSLRYQTKTYDERVSSLRVFCQQEQRFLKGYYWLRQLPELFKPKELFSVIEDSQAQEQAKKMLQGFEIANDKICCTDASALQALIPYVKRLLQLFPQIKENTERALSSGEVRNRVYQIETRRYVERIRQRPRHFKEDDISLRDFVRNDHEQVLQLQMIDGDEWTGLIKVYRSLQNTGCLSEGQYTVLKLKHLLSINHLMDFSTLMQSIGTPHLLLMACDTNQLLNAEAQHIIRKIFNTIKQKPNIKIFLTIRSDSTTLPSVQQIVREIFGEGFVTRDEQLTWSDMTTESQEKLLTQTVNFQGIDIALNELISAGSSVAKLLPLVTLMEGKHLQIGKPVPISNAYNEGCYIGRTVRQHRAIKQDILIDIRKKEFPDLIASTEQEFSKFVQLNPENNVHWLEKDKSGKLIWQQSQGSLETLRRYIDTDSSHTYTADDLDKLLEQVQHQKVIMISDTAGMGKSTVLTHLSKEIKQKFPNKWVVRIDLNDHTDALKALLQEQIDKQKAIEFVSAKLLTLKPGFELELFKQCCEQNQKVKPVIMLDGFDEISPFYKETVIDLLQGLRQTAVEQLWVSTRPHLKEELEDKLHQLSYTLEPFSEENQVEFLTKFWSLKEWFTEPDDKGEEKEKNKLQIFAKCLIKELTKSISDKDREFTGIPLQTRLLAEAFDKEVRIFYQSTKSKPEISFKLDLLGLYLRFIERKYDIYQEEKFHVPVSNVIAREQRERDLKCMREDHQLLAFKLLFTEEQVALFQNITECSFSTQQLTRIGIVQVHHDGKPHFIHRTFAEFYVADCLVNCLTEGSNSSEQVQTFILKDIFQKDDYRVVRVFMDRLLSRSEPSEQVLKEYGNQIHGLQKESQLDGGDDGGNDDEDDDDEDDDSDDDDDDDDDADYDDFVDDEDDDDDYYGSFKIWGDSLQLLHRAVREGNANIIGFLLDSAQTAQDTDSVNKLLLAQDEEGRTAWQQAVFSHNIQVLQKLWECAKENLTAEEINNKLLLATDYEGRTAWHLAAEWGNLGILQQVWQWAKEKLTTEEINNKLLLATDNEGRTTWHVAALSGNLEKLKKLWEWAKEKLTTEEINNKLLLATDDKGRTAWHVAAEWDKLAILKKLWEWAEENLTTEEINNKFLLGTDNKGRTLWHVSAVRGNLAILQKVWKWSKEKIATDEISKKLLLGTDNKGRTVWHVAAKSGNLATLQKVWEWAEEKLTTEEINNKLLLATDDKGRTAWHVAAEWDKLAILKKLWEWAEEKLTTEEINNKLLLARDYEGMTAWHVAAKSGNLEILQKVWEWAEEKLTTEEINNKLLLATDDKGRTVWHVAAEWDKLAILKKLWEWAEEKLTTEEINNKLLLATDDKGRTVWHVAADWGKLGILQELWEWAEKKLTTEEIKNKLLLSTDNNGWTAWHMAAMCGNVGILEQVSEWAKEKLTTEEITNNLLLATDNKGRTAWQVAAEWGNLGILQKVWEWAEKKLTTEEIKNKLLLATDNEGRTLWHVAAEWGNVETLQKLWEWSNETLTTEEIHNKLLLATDNTGKTLWHVAAVRVNLGILQKLWEWAKEKLTTEEINNKLLLGTDHKGWTVCHFAAERENLETLQKVWELSQEKLTTEEINNKLLLATDNKGRTTWHVAAVWGNLRILKQVWKWANEKLTTEETNNKLLLGTDNEGRTAWHVAAFCGNVGILQQLWEWAEKRLTTEEMKNKLLLSTDNNGWTAWHMAVMCGDVGILEQISEWAKEKLTTEEINNNLLLGTDNEGMTAWHLAAKKDNLETLQKVWECAKMQITTEEINNKLLLSTDNEGMTVWHVVTGKGDFVGLQKLSDWAKGKLTAGEKNKFLLGTDNKGRTVWLVAAKKSYLEGFTESAGLS